MRRTTFAGLGIAAAVLAAAPVWAASMVDISGALATDSAASATSGTGAASVLKGVKGSLARSMPSFQPPKMDTPVQATTKTPQASGPAATQRPASPSMSASHGSSGASAWRVGTNSRGGDSPYKTGWATSAKSGSSSGSPGQRWAKASTVSHGATAGNAWKPGGTGARTASN